MFPTRCYVREKWQHWPCCHIMFFVPIWFLWLCLPSQPRFWSSHIFCVFFVQLIHFQKRYMFPVCTITRIHRIQRVGFFVTALIGLLVSETKPGMSQYKLRHTEIASVQIVPRVPSVPSVCCWCSAWCVWWFAWCAWCRVFLRARSCSRHWSNAVDPNT